MSKSVWEIVLKHWIYNRFSLFLIFTLMSPTFAYAEEEYQQRDGRSRSRFGIHFDRYKGGNTNSGTQGAIFGVRYSNYFEKSPLSIGVQMNVGAPEDGAIIDNNIFYTGVTLGIDNTIYKITFFDLSVLVGYGYGKLTSRGISGQSIVVQPTIALGLVVVRGYRASFSGGYQYMPNTPGFSGIMFGLRFERKTDSLPSRGTDF